MSFSSPLLPAADPADLASCVAAWHIADRERGVRNLQSLLDSGLSGDLFALLCRQLGEHLPTTSDPDRVLNNLERFVGALRNPLAFGGLCERDTDTLPTLLQIFSASQHLSEYLIRDPEAFDLVRMTSGDPTPREPLLNDVLAEVLSVSEERSQMAAIRRIKQRETLRIVYGDVVRRQSIAVVTRQISWLADAMVEAAVQCARQRLMAQRGGIRPDEWAKTEFVVLALGKLGGEELNYSSDIDLIFCCDVHAIEPSRRPAAIDALERLARQIIRLLAEKTESGSAYRVDVRLRPRGQSGPLVPTLDEMLHYYDLHGRTWERQAFIKARVVAGDRATGENLLAQLQPWIYRRYLNRADITGIKALKRRIEQRALREGASERDVKTGEGGLRDIEFVTQFLQLLNGGDLPELRTGNTLEALHRLEQAGCLTSQEAMLLAANYEFLRRIEHRLQVMFDLQTHALSDSEDEVRKLALRMHYADGAESAVVQFRREYRERTQVNRKILDHLLHSAFPDDPAVSPETDLVLDPEPATELISHVLAKYHFHQPLEAYRSLVDLAAEKIPFLSTRRCRHFLSAIAPELLTAIALTPHPDHTLRNLCRVSDSLGGKGVLWELMHVHPPTLQLYVRLCAASPYLSDLLVANPGMIDELLDSLLLDRLPGLPSLLGTLDDLCRGAEDIEPILLGFKNSLHLRVGVRDILGKEQITATHHALSDIMEAVLTRVVEHEFKRLAEKHGRPLVAEGPRAGQPCELLLVALGKLGGREPNYHSDCDVLFLYEGEGTTRLLGRRGKAVISNHHFFGQLVQRVIKTLTRSGPQGRLYDIDLRLRPAGGAGPLAISLADFEKYFATGVTSLWERQMLCKARLLTGSELARIKTQHAIRSAIHGVPWQPEFTSQIAGMREKLEHGASPRNLKRGPGGTMDIEFIVQMLQLQSGRQHPGIVTPGTLDSLDQLARLGLLPVEEVRWLSHAYLFLRRVESGLRLLDTTARHDLPDDPAELEQLAFLLGLPVERLEQECLCTMAENRDRFRRYFATEE